MQTKLSTLDQLLAALVFSVLVYCKMEGPMTWTRFWIYGFVGSFNALTVSAMFRLRR